MTTSPRILQKLPWFPWIGKKRPFYGWIIVVTGMLTWFANNLQGNAFTTYLPLLQKEFGWSRALLAGPQSIAQLEASILGPVEGVLMDRFGPRLLITIGLFTMGLGLIFFGYIQTLWMFYMVQFIITIGLSFASPFIVSIVVNHWFRRRRSIANSLVGMGYGLSTVVGVPVVVFLQGDLGWRTASMLTGFFIWIVGIPAVLFFRRSPEPYGLQMDGELSDSLSATEEGNDAKSDVKEYDFTLREALHTRAFWFLAIGQALISLGWSVIGVHLFLHLEGGVGLTPSSAALIVSITGIANVASRLVGGFLGDKLPKHLVVGTTSALIATSIFILGIASSLPMAIAYALVYGIGVGARTPVMNSMQGEYFGRKYQGIIRGLLNLMSGLFALASPVVAGLIADNMGSYRLAFIGVSLIASAGSILLLFTTPPQPPTTKKTGR